MYVSKFDFPLKRSVVGIFAIPGNDYFEGPSMLNLVVKSWQGKLCANSYRFSRQKT